MPGVQNVWCLEHPPPQQLEKCETEQVGPRSVRSVIILPFSGLISPLRGEADGQTFTKTLSCRAGPDC